MAFLLEVSCLLFIVLHLLFLSNQYILCLGPAITITITSILISHNTSDWNHDHHHNISLNDTREISSIQLQLQPHHPHNHTPDPPSNPLHYSPPPPHQTHILIHDFNTNPDSINTAPLLPIKDQTKPYKLFPTKSLIPSPKPLTSKPPSHHHNTTKQIGLLQAQKPQYPHLTHAHRTQPHFLQQAPKTKAQAQLASTFFASPIVSFPSPKRGISDPRTFALHGVFLFPALLTLCCVGLAWIRGRKSALPNIAEDDGRAFLAYCRGR
jgi:hypothetical protein